jgi:cell division protein ZapA
MSAGEQSLKHPLQLSIFNQTFSLLVSGEAAELEAAAAEVDRLLNAIAARGNADSLRVALLACLHLQDRVRVLEKELQQLRERVGVKSRDLADKLSRIIEEAQQPGPT